MAKANLVLPNGTTVNMEGTAEDIAVLIGKISSQETDSIGNCSGISSVTVQENEIPGIAIYDGDNNIKFTFRDIKAKNAKDAAVRLALVSTYVHEQFTGEKIAPRQLTLTPLLKDWRINCGNSRAAIVAHKGIIAEGQNKVQLDSHAKNEAEEIIRQINDESVVGKWKPSATKRKHKKTKK